MKLDEYAEGDDIPRGSDASKRKSSIDVILCPLCASGRLLVMVSCVDSKNSKRKYNTNTDCAVMLVCK
jgi:hypothetical protein